jgi:uncharacterized protein
MRSATVQPPAPVARSQSILSDVPFLSLFPFLLMSFGIGWGILALYIFLPDLMSGMFGQLTGNHPLFFLAVWSPAIAAVILVLYHSGVPGVKRFGARLLLWRAPVAWYAFLIIGIPLVFLGGAAIRGNLFTDPFPFPSWQPLVVAMVLAAIKGPLEEFGWRGVALPILQRKMAPIAAALVLGALWGLWHLPAFLLSGTQQSQWSFGPFFLGCIALSVIVTPLFNTSGGSILLAALFHYLLMNPILPDAEPYDTYILVVVAVVIVLLHRGRMFTRAHAVTQVVPARVVETPEGL